jgi:3D (Asp-Asp-Asp) domain-containing protein
LLAADYPRLIAAHPPDYQNFLALASVIFSCFRPLARASSTRVFEHSKPLLRLASSDLVFPPSRHFFGRSHTLFRCRAVLRNNRFRAIGSHWVGGKFAVICFRACTLAILLTAVLFARQPHAANGRYLATAYDQSGITASGLYTHRHIVAADPNLLPIGSIIRIKHAGRYSGEYVVADTGEKIVGRRLDIYIPNLAACKKFGVRTVKVKVVRLGDNTHQAATVADREVKQDIQQDLEHHAPLGAATADDQATHLPGSLTKPANTLNNKISAPLSAK